MTAERSEFANSGNTGNISIAIDGPAGAGKKRGNIMMMNGIEAVIFDLDGSLVDSMWIWKDIDIDYLGRFGLVPHSYICPKPSGSSPP